MYVDINLSNPVYTIFANAHGAKKVRILLAETKLCITSSKTRQISHYNLSSAVLVTLVIVVPPHYEWGKLRHFLFLLL